MFYTIAPFEPLVMFSTFLNLLIIFLDFQEYFLYNRGFIEKYAIIIDTGIYRMIHDQQTISYSAILHDFPSIAQCLICILSYALNYKGRNEVL